MVRNFVVRAVVAADRSREGDGVESEPRPCPVLVFADHAFNCEVSIRMGTSCCIAIEPLCCKMLTVSLHMTFHCFDKECDARHLVTSASVCAQHGTYIAIPMSCQTLSVLKFNQLQRTTCSIPMASVSDKPPTAG